jgi:hypothetical protein
MSLTSLGDGGRDWVGVFIKWNSQMMILFISVSSLHTGKYSNILC